ncbi:MAG: hypothetical protein KDA78_04005 [Planctomycetaceae bacterium]|nr:hypothetical protein [Planctomycetaceae bacterium]
MELPARFDLFNVAADVIIRFRGQGAYKSRKNALLALSRRVPDATEQDCETAFEFLSARFNAANELVIECNAKGRLSFDECQQALSFNTPPYTWKSIHDILAWLIYYQTR